MMNNVNAIEEIDISGMHRILRAFPEQCRRALAKGDNLQVQKYIGHTDISQIVFCGLGGSAIGGDALRVTYQHHGVRIAVHRDYHLPPDVDERALVITTSYSGNTEETLSCYEDARKAGCGVIAIASGGELAAVARRYASPFIELPSGLPPRCAIGFLTLPIAVLLSKVFATQQDFEEMPHVLAAISGQCSIEIEPQENPAKALALELLDKTPLFYGTSGPGEVIARRAKTQLNENAKRFAGWDVFPEVAHNEILPWSGEGHIDLTRYRAVFIRDQEEPERIQYRIKITQHLFENREVGYSQIWTRGEGIMTRILSGIHIADWASYYIAILQRTDPTPIHFIDRLKNELRKTL